MSSAEGEAYSEGTEQPSVRIKDILLNLQQLRSLVSEKTHLLYYSICGHHSVVHWELTSRAQTNEFDHDCNED